MTTQIEKSFTLPVSLKLEYLPIVEDWVYCRVSYTHSNKLRYFTTFTKAANVAEFLEKATLSFEILHVNDFGARVHPFLATRKSQLELQLKGYGHWDTIENLIALRINATDVDSFDDFEDVVAFMAANTDARIVWGDAYNHRLTSLKGFPLKLGLVMDSSVYYHDLSLDIVKTAEQMAKSGKFFPLGCTSETLKSSVSPESLIKDIPYYNRSSYAASEISEELLRLKGFVPADYSDADDEPEIENSKYLGFVYWPSNADWAKLSKDNDNLSPNSLLDKARELGLLPLVGYKGFVC